MTCFCCHLPLFNKWTIWLNAHLLGRFPTLAACRLNFERLAFCRLIPQNSVCSEFLLLIHCIKGSPCSGDGVNSLKSLPGLLWCTLTCLVKVGRKWKEGFEFACGVTWAINVSIWHSPRVTKFLTIIIVYILLGYRWCSWTPYYTQSCLRTACVICRHTYIYIMLHMWMASPFQLYNDSRALCNTLWGPSFEYSTDVSTSPNRTCLVPWFNDTDTNPNEAVVRRIFGITNAATSAGGFTYLLAVTALTIFSVLSTLLWPTHSICAVEAITSNFATSYAIVHTFIASLIELEISSF